MRTDAIPTAARLDLSDLSEWFGRPGPFASVYLESPSAVDDATERLEKRWSAARRVLAERGAGDRQLEALDAVIAGRHRGGDTIAAFVDAEGSAARVMLPEPITGDLVAFGALPRFGPVIETRQLSVPHLHVLADRVGADIVAVAGDAPRLDGVDEEPVVDQVDGSEHHVQRSHPGGWSQRRFQQRAENLWEQNSSEVADAVTALADEVGARVIVLGGDQRATGFVIDHLPERWRDAVREGLGSRHDVDDAVAVRAAATVAAEDTVAVLRAFGDARGTDTAADGPEATLRALTEGRVDLALVHDDPDDDRRAYRGTDLTEVALRAEDLTALGRPAHEARLADLVIASALATGADVRVVPAHGPQAPSGGVGALLRW